MRWRQRNVENKRDASAKLLLSLIPCFLRPQRGFPNMVPRKNEYLWALNASYTFQPLMSFWFNLMLSWIIKATTLHVHYAFCLHTFKPSNFTISVGREQKATTFVYFSEIRNSLLEFNSRKGRQHLTKWRANKFKIARIHSLSDVFAAVIAVVVDENEILKTARYKFYLQG